MVRITMIVLCLLLAAAAAGRYQAEAAVREKRQEIERLQKERAAEIMAIKTLRADIAFLTNPERLARIAQSRTDLSPLSGAQLIDAEKFALAFARPGAGERNAVAPPARRAAAYALAEAVE